MYHAVASASPSVCKRIQLLKENNANEGPSEDYSSLLGEEHALRAETCCDTLFVNSKPAGTLIFAW